MSAWGLAVTLCPQLITLVACSADSPPHRLTSAIRGAPAFFHARRLSPNSRHTIDAACAIVRKMFERRFRAIQPMQRLLLLYLLQMILRAFRERIQAGRRHALLRPVALRHHVACAEVGLVVLQAGGQHLLNTLAAKRRSRTV